MCAMAIRGKLTRYCEQYRLVNQAGVQWQPRSIGGDALLCNEQFCAEQVQSTLVLPELFPNSLKQRRRNHRILQVCWVECD